MILASSGVNRFSCFPSFVTAGFSSREFTNARRTDFLSALSLPTDSLILVKQVHGDRVMTVRKPDPAWIDTESDGLITSEPGLVLGIRTADCVPVFFSSKTRSVIGIAHGGWKGIKAGILSSMIRSFQDQYDVTPADLIVGIGPCIRSCCYEVGEEFMDYFPGFYTPISSQNGRFDLAGKVANELVSLGIDRGFIHDCNLCTSCQNDHFFSYRREKQTKERILNVISLVG